MYQFWKRSSRHTQYKIREESIHPFNPIYHIGYPDKTIVGICFACNYQHWHKLTVSLFSVLLCYTHTPRLFGSIVPFPPFNSIYMFLCMTFRIVFLKYSFSSCDALLLLLLLLVWYLHPCFILPLV